MTLVETTVKGINEYVIADAAGSTIARAHKVNRLIDLYSLVIPGRGPVLGTEAEVKAKMTELVAAANA